MCSRWQGDADAVSALCRATRVRTAQQASESERAGVREKTNSVSPSTLSGGVGALSPVSARERRGSWAGGRSGLVGSTRSRANWAMAGENERREWRRHGPAGLGCGEDRGEEERSGVSVDFDSRWREEKEKGLKFFICFATLI